MARFDIVVIGAGHAGVEAASAAARLGRSVACVTFRREHIGRLSCNPAVGGQGKGQLVRELDALGGLMGRAADAACIQFRRLNTRKGLAVRASRAQVDVDRYPAWVRAALGMQQGLVIVEGEAVALRTTGGRVAGVTLADGMDLDCDAVILTTGTFLGAIMHRGDTRMPGGRVGDGAAHRLAESVRALGLRTGRLKTGTVPRLDAATIRWDALEAQDDVDPSGRFSFAEGRAPRLPQVTCYRAYTSPSVHALIRGALDRSPLYTGAIQGRGPRYCPSVEDKVVRFPDRERHLLFLEPEGLDTHRVYVNGLSTSLPVDVQTEVVRGVVGLEHARVLEYGYAVEYDFVDPQQLDDSLQVRSVPGLYCAGQICGTSGYEEAAVQGFVAGVSAAIGEPMRLGRDQAYIGVLIDDLVSRGVGGEPYRMFSSRAEHRLLLREDNADQRLMPRGRALGLVDDATFAAFEARRGEFEDATRWLGANVVTPRAEVQARLEAVGLARITGACTLGDLLARPNATWAQVSCVAEGAPPVRPEVAEQLEIANRYAGYVTVAERRASREAAVRDLELPEGLDFRALEHLSWEVRERLAGARPRTLAHAARVPGVTAAALSTLAGLMLRAQRASARPLEADGAAASVTQQVGVLPNDLEVGPVWDGLVYEEED